MTNYRAAVAAAAILAGVILVLMLLPRIMYAISGLGPWAGLGLAIIVMVGFFAIFWARSRYQGRGPSGGA
ncbi:hypothetical protein [Propylenella binzhouense]|uniref:Uncharacterized protein n=1 Tax=Propylenella binzhouense TaxID=2555902 RepID=A0A964T5P7_9HYPH|nr:hypothetical protein [Propylenella binzhouense]MYZ49001.1 hypothetical protein [Propylenella binzhouense]